MKFFHKIKSLTENAISYDVTFGVILNTVPPLPQDFGRSVNPIPTKIMHTSLLLALPPLGF